MVEELKKVVQSLCEKYGVPARLESVSDTLDTILSLSPIINDEEATKLRDLVRKGIHLPIDESGDKQRSEEYAKADICLDVLENPYDYRRTFAKQMIEEELSRLPIKKVFFEETGWIFGIEDEWMEYAKEKGWGVEEIRKALALLQKTFASLPYFVDYHWLSERYEPRVYELYSELQSLGLDKTNAFRFSSFFAEWEGLIELAKKGFTPEEIDVLNGYEVQGYTILSGRFWEQKDFLNEEFFGEVVRELEKEHGLDEESSWELVKKYNREILDSIDEVKFVEGEVRVQIITSYRNYAYYCKNEDLPKVKERFKEEIARRLEANPELGR